MNSTLSALQKSIDLLVQDTTGGSRRKFADLVGYSHTQISRVCSGQQEPGTALLERIAKLPEVGTDHLIQKTLLRSKSTGAGANRVRRAESLLSGPPHEHPFCLLPESVSVPADTWSRTQYAVRAKDCIGGADLRVERLFSEDLLIIEASTELLPDTARLRDRMWVIQEGIDLSVLRVRGQLQERLLHPSPPAVTNREPVRSLEFRVDPPDSDESESVSVSESSAEEPKDDSPQRNTDKSVSSIDNVRGLVVLVLRA